MQYDENAEKYGYEGEMTPLKCDKLTACKGDVTISIYGTIADAEVYLKKDVDEAIAELKEFAEDACIERDDNQTAIDELQAENAELKAKLENVQASMYADAVDANMENRRLKRALYNLRACYADMMQKRYIECKTDGWVHRVNKWIEVERRCLKKAEEYK